MKCDNKICMYQVDGQCRNAEIEIDWRGSCKSMTPVRITARDLEKLKLYSNTIIKCKDYHFDTESGEYIWDTGICFDETDI